MSFPEMTPEDLEEIIKTAVREALGALPRSWPRWLTTREASRYSGLSARTLRELARAGEIYAVPSPGGGKLLFDRESIDEYFLREKASLKEHLELLKRRGLC